ncbi:DNA primase [Candidatus Wolfebacteria bacterium CG1_02_39_135]|uniref:DNA primase n=6 Tax=Candidatus Wolfeibacteriota TaxID=1752735 RepID=A0A2M8D8Q8_9BACT|nr:MAG: DNA primase [Candidatus Wolfebacteria bacterium CG1_02_39_135]PJB83540.1 MAG: DNA primase [Candidatus Wolfebacteria bacterium CG_4_9_14_0_8_um_filter_39_46]
MTSPVQEIKERLDIVDFIRSYIPLTPAGKNLKALCPFHREKTPSFMVSPERQMWHCFGSCGEGGDIFKFLMKYENLEFYEALKILAEKAGVELKKISPAEHKQFGILYDISQSAKDFFKKQLEQSTETLNYLKERGLKKETIEEFELGLAPNKFDDLSRYLTNSGYDIKDVERAGLIFKTERGSYVDRFRERIMFPLYNHFGKVVGFSGRVLPRLEAEKPELGKYINTPETLIFNKSRILYGFHKTKKHILEQKSAVLVEGQMDFLMAYQDGVKNVIATSGTALTFDHLKTIRRLAEQLILCFDNDEAGFNAVERAIDLANANDFNVKILTLQDFKDPAEAAQKSPGALAGLIKETKPAMEFYFERYLKEKVKLELPEFKKKIRIVLAKIKNLASAVERAQWLKELSQRTKIEEKTLAEEMEQLKTLNYAEKNAELRRNSPRQSASSLRESACSRRELICQRLISLAILDKDFQERINEHLDYFLEDYSLILKCLREEAKLEDERLNNLLNLISLRSSFESSILDPEKIEKEFQELLHQLRIEYLKEKRQGLTGLVKEAEGTGDETKVASVLKEFNEVSKSIQNA